ncbi:hypothetical protein GCM10009555_062540 [Acrocarpospora macrocephala]|uniref:Uncharacterized protein n=1 Tax=Acrocarpospora macrocephala TaxID=150177 RepID=A0A5M3WKH2_9ACTN|nr:hypothetical protein Amac_032930 [Acrocarpospora macrocephala]
MHCAHTRYPHRRGPYPLFPAGGNQPGPFDQLDALAWNQAWNQVPISWTTCDRGRARIEIRAIQVQPAPPTTRFPHLKQVYLAEPHAFDLELQALAGRGGAGRHEPDRDADRSPPPDRTRPRPVAIDNRDHYVRDVTVREDCWVRTDSTLSIPATMRSYAIGATPAQLHQHRRQNPLGPRLPHPLIALGLTV